jgi:hypothetical protein
MSKPLPVKHIGNIRSLCAANVRSSLREDMSLGEYQALPRHRFKGEPPFRMCKRCIAVLTRRRKGGLLP